MKFFTQLLLGTLVLAATSASAFPMRRGQACFYQDHNFQGQAMCFPSGTQINRLGEYGFNDKISSINLQGVRRVYLCTDANFTGRCVDIYNDVYGVGRELGRAFNDAITSIYIE